MNKLLKTPLRLTGWLFAAALIAGAQTSNSGRPGMINYTEGQVLLNGNTIGSRSIGRAEAAPGEVLQTRQGRAEMLLTPGVFLRLGQNSAVKMIDPSIIHTQVQLQQGKAMIEVDQIADENHLNVLTNGLEARLVKKGIYEFHANPGLLAVYDGKAVVSADDRSIDIKKGRELPLEPGLASVKPKKFDRDQTDELYAWSKLRSSYVAEANASSAQTIVVNNPGWYAGTGWYWNPWYDSWAFVPGAGFIDSPFGFGFYSPAYWYAYAPIYPYYSRFGRVYHGRLPVYRSGGFRSVAPAGRAITPRFGGASRMAAPHIGGMRAAGRRR
jgi:hypothetical protein